MFTSSLEGKLDNIVSAASVLTQIASHLKNVQRAQKTRWNFVAQKSIGTAQQRGSTFNRDAESQVPAQDVMGERPARI